MPEEDPFTILHDRYARGEITIEQYNEMLKNLQNSRQEQQIQPGSEDANALLQAGLSDLQNLEFNKALAAFDQVILLNPSSDDAWNSKGVVLANLKKYQEAYDAFNKAVTINPANLTAVKNRNNAKIFINVAPAPNFSLEPLKGTNVLMAPNFCPHCGTEITHQEAEICPNCGVRVKEAPQIKGEKSPGIAALLSAIFPGLGQVYDGDLTRGVIFLIGTFVGALFFLIPGVIVWVYQIYDAYSRAKKMNVGEIPFKEASAVHIILYFVLFAVIIIIMAAVIAAFVFGMAGSTVQPYG